MKELFKDGFSVKTYYYEINVRGYKSPYSAKRAFNRFKRKGFGRRIGRCFVDRGSYYIASVKRGIEVIIKGKNFKDMKDAENHARELCNKLNIRLEEVWN